MTRHENDESYLIIVKDIMNNKNFLKLQELNHHSTTRYNHSLKVSYYSYRIAKFLKLKHDDVARAGLLHDFYLESIYDCPTVKEKIKLFTVQHPLDAVEQSKLNFSINKSEEDIIKGHMFPLDYKYPKSPEGWVVNLVDKCVSVKEFSQKFGAEFSYSLNVIVLFLLNNITRL